MTPGLPSAQSRTYHHIPCRPGVPRAWHSAWPVFTSVKGLETCHPDQVHCSSLNKQDPSLSDLLLVPLRCPPTVLILATSQLRPPQRSPGLLPALSACTSTLQSQEAWLLKILGAMSLPSTEPLLALAPAPPPHRPQVLCALACPAHLSASAMVASITACLFLPQGLCTGS